MAWTDFSRGVGEVVASPRESARFGLTVSRLTVGTGWEGGIEQVAEAVWSRIGADDSDILILRYPSELVRLPSFGMGLEGRTVLPAGSIVYWSGSPQRMLAAAEPSDATVSLVAGDEWPSAAEVFDALVDSFTGYVSHYAANPLLDGALVAEGYREGAESTLADAAGRVYAMTDDDRVIGVAVVKELDDGAREIELAGMVADAQGAGLYGQLLRAVAADSGEAELYISTQSHNIRVQRAWARAGLLPLQSMDTVHVLRQVE